jgi:hypothetical protein
VEVVDLINLWSANKVTVNPTTVYGHPTPRPVNGANSGTIDGLVQHARGGVAAEIAFLHALGRRSSGNFAQMVAAVGMNSGTLDFFAYMGFQVYRVSMGTSTARYRTLELTGLRITSVAYSANRTVQATGATAVTLQAALNAGTGCAVNDAVFAEEQYVAGAGPAAVSGGPPPAILPAPPADTAGAWTATLGVCIGAADQSRTRVVQGVAVPDA